MLEFVAVAVIVVVAAAVVVAGVVAVGVAVVAVAVAAVVLLCSTIVGVVTGRANWDFPFRSGKLPLNGLA